MGYSDFLKKKTSCSSAPVGIKAEIDKTLYPFQGKVVCVALAKERFAVFADCGMGKTLMQLEWSKHVSDQCGPVLILAPLAVADQTVREGKKIGLDVYHSREGLIGPGVTVANYERLHKFSPDGLSGIVLDESSILKAYSGKTRTAIIDFARGIRFRLACTATPAPNDYEEIGNHSEFLGQMRRVEMLSTFFSHDGGDTSKWSLKGHGAKPFWSWMSQWSMAMRSPMDIGFDDNRFSLPPLNVQEHIVKSKAANGRLFVVEASSLAERRDARRRSMSDRVDLAASIGNHDRPFLAWCNLNAESESLTNAIDGAVEIAGKHDDEYKERAMLSFSSMDIRAVVTKPSIAGHGMNWQHCSDMAFVGLSDSYEEMYQAVRRCWRYGQTRPVNAHIIISEEEGSVLANIRRKEKQAAEMFGELVAHVGREYNGYSQYNPEKKMDLPAFLKG